MKALTRQIPGLVGITPQAPNKGTGKVTGKNLEGKNVTLLRTYPQQMELFQLFHQDAERYSNSIELYDAAPKYFSCPKKMAAMRKDGVYLPTLKRHFKYGINSRYDEYILEVRPARIDRDGKEVECYPTERESLVEEALRKIATDILRGVYLDNKAGVQFTLYQLQQELKKYGHSIHYKNLLESLYICGRSRLTIKTSDGKAILESSIFPEIIIRNRKDWLKNPSETLCYVQFNSLVTDSINHLNYRQHDYKKWMSYKSMLSRWIHKKVWNKFVYAASDKNYHIKASTIIRDSGLVNNSQFRDCIKAIDSSFKELNKNRILILYKKKPIFEKRRLVDVVYEIMATGEFTDEMKIANKRQLIIESHIESSGTDEMKMAYKQRLTQAFKKSEDSWV